MFKLSFSEVIFFIIILTSLIFFQTKGFIAYDEGWILNAAQRINLGDVPYRDFYFLYTPGAIFSVAFIFKLLGPSILSARIFAILCSLVSCLALYKIILKTINSKLLAISSILIFLLWGPFQVNFTWMVMFSITLTLLMIYFLLETLKSKNLMNVVWAGVFCGVTLLFKQNFGAAAILIALIAFITNKKLLNSTLIVRFLAGFFTPILVFIVYLALNSSLLLFINQMIFLMFQKLLIDGMLSTPFIYPDSPPKTAIKLLFYLFPFLISLPSLYLLYKRERKYLFVASFPLLFYILSIRPTTDIIHLVPLISLSGISLGFVYRYGKEKIKLLAVACFIFLIAFGSYFVIYRGYYRWGRPILTNTYFYSDSKVNIFLNDQDNIRLILNELRKSKSSNIFVYHFSPIWYFLSDKQNPTYYDDLPEPLMTSEVQKSVTADIKKSRVDTVLSDSDIRGEKSIIASFIRKNYKLKEQIESYQIWVR